MCEPKIKPLYVKLRKTQKQAMDSEGRQSKFIDELRYSLVCSIHLQPSLSLDSLEIEVCLEPVDKVPSV